MLFNQSAFARDCVRAIAQLYAENVAKSSKAASAEKINGKRLVVISHSMGGVVARGLFLDDAGPQSKAPIADKIDAIITLNTPHRYV